MQTLRLTSLAAAVGLLLLPAGAYAFSGTSGQSAYTNSTTTATGSAAAGAVTDPNAAAATAVPGSVPAAAPLAPTAATSAQTGAPLTPEAILNQPAPAGTVPAAAAVPPGGNIAATLPGAPASLKTDTTKNDPCAAFMSSYNAYVTCQDRMQKIAALKAASSKRADDFKAPPAPAAGTASAAPTTKDGKTTPAPANGTTAPSAGVPLNAALNSAGAGGNSSTTSTTPTAATTTTK